MNYKYLISVIIPTRNRQIYAAACVKHIYSLDKSIQVIINDNSDDNSLFDTIKQYVDGDRVIYNFINERISAVDNFNNAVEYVTGEFFCSIGDDDTVLPSIVECANWMKLNNVDGVKSSTYNNYWWPNKNDSIFSKTRFGCIWCDTVEYKVKKCDTVSAVIQLLKNGGQNYMRLDIAKSYHGLVKTSRMLEVKSKTGYFYSGISPDIYSAVCLSLLDGFKLYEIGFPITLLGVCSRSTSSDSTHGKHAGPLESAPHFIGMKTPYVWDKLIPKYYTVQTIWAEAAVKAVRMSGYEHLLQEYFNRQALIKEMINKNPEHKEAIEQIVYEQFNEKCQEFEKEIFNKRNKRDTFFARLSRLISRKMLVSFHCKDIITASKKLNKYLNKKSNAKIWERTLNTKV